MENKKEKISDDKNDKILKIKNLSKNVIDKDNKNIKNKFSGKTFKKKRNNFMNLKINNKFEDNNENFENKNKEIFVLNTIQNLQKNKIKNISVECNEILNKKEENLKLKKLNELNNNYLTKRNKIKNFSDIKVKKRKSNFNSIILNFKKENEINICKLNNIKTKVNKNNNNSKVSYSYIFKKEKDKNRKKKNNNNKIYNYLFKDFLIRLNKENLSGSQYINKYSKSFVKEHLKLEQKLNIINNNKGKENYYCKSKDENKKRNISKSFEDKKYIIKQRFKRSINQKNNNKQKKEKKKYNLSLISKKIKKLNNYNNYQRTYNSSSFSKSFPITINKIKFKNKNKGKMSSIGRINSHKKLITNININIYNENKNNGFINNDENIQKNLNFRTEIISEENNFDFEKLYFLEEKVLKILKKINDYISCDEECFNWINYYFGVRFYEKELSPFKKIDNYKKMNNYAKLEIICYFLCYNISLNQNFSKASILLKSIINILHQNYLILISYLLYLHNNINYNDDLWIDKIEKIIKKELKINLSNQDMNEDSITFLIIDKVNNILNYYEMVIDNLYSLGNKEINNEDIFPNCLKLNKNNINKEQKSRIISLFFIEANKSLKNYTFENIKLFFYSYINIQKYSFINDKNNINIKEKKEKQFYLAPIKPRYKYTLIINLDETLIYYNNSKVILRPNLFEFLSKIKELFEIIAFSFYSDSIINEALELIENKNKYFDYVLYSDQLTISYNGKFVKDLDNFGRNEMNIIIIDTKINIPKKYKNNLVLIKGFYGDETKDINLLKMLRYFLQNIKNDNYDEDIRNRINKYKKCIKTYLY